MQRRDFMKLLGGVGLAGTLPGLGLSTAQAAEPFNGLALITVSAGGGWDQSSFADPRENPDINHWAETAPAGSAGGLRYAPMGENEAFFQRHHGRTLVINGIDLQTNGHSGAEQTQNSGSLSGVPGLNTLYAAIAGDGLPMPWLHHSGYSGAPLLTPQTSLPSLAQMLQLADSNRRDTDRLYFRRSDMELIDQARIARLQAQREAADLLPFTRRKLDELYFARTAHVQRTLRRILGIDGHPLAQTYALDVPEIDLLNPAYSSPVQV